MVEMIEEDSTLSIGIFWDDLTQEVKDEITDTLYDYGIADYISDSNYDMFPFGIHSISLYECEKNDER